MPELLNCLLIAYHTNNTYKGAVVRGVEYRVNPDCTYACSVFFELIYSPDYDSSFWLTDAFELDKYVIAINKREHLTEIVFRSNGKDLSFFPKRESLKMTNENLKKDLR